MSSKETAEAIFIVIKKMGKWFLYFISFLFVIFLIFYAYTSIEARYQNRPKIVKSFEDITLGDKFQDFMFRNNGFALDADKEIDKDKDKKFNDLIYYTNKEKNTFVTLRDTKIVRVVYQCKGESDSKSINGMYCYSNGDSVVTNYDREIRVQCLKDRSDVNFLKYRVYDAAKFGIRFHLYSNKIVGFDIANSTEFGNADGFINKNWAACE